MTDKMFGDRGLPRPPEEFAWGRVMAFGLNGAFWMVVASMFLAAVSH